MNTVYKFICSSLSARVICSNKQNLDSIHVTRDQYLNPRKVHKQNHDIMTLSDPFFCIYEASKMTEITVSDDCILRNMSIFQVMYAKPRSRSVSFAVRFK